MKYIDFRSPGPPEVMRIAEGPTPEPSPNEILVQVKAAGVNRPDLSQRAGNYPPPKGASPILGLEIAGTVFKVGSSVTRWKVGDSLCALTNGGGYAEYCAVPEGQCLPLPEGLNFVEAASLPETYFTVWGNLFMRGRLKAGEDVLIHAGASGIGSCAIQLAKATGARVFTTVSSAEKGAFCSQIGADRTINYKEEDFFAALKEQGVDVILDIVGTDYFEKNLSLLKEEGRLVQVSLMSGTMASLDLGRLLFKRLTILGSTLRAQSSEAKAQIAQGLMQNVWPLFQKKKLRPVVFAILPLSHAADAHKLMESNRHLGKIVLSID